MHDSLPRRIRFAHYFASVAMSDSFRINWTKYHADLLKEQQDKQLELEQQVTKLGSVSPADLPNLPPEKQAALQTTQRKVEQLQFDLQPSWLGMFDPSAQLRNWVAQEPANEKTLAAWMQEKKIDAHLSAFLMSSNFEESRKEAAQALVPLMYTGLPNFKNRLIMQQGLGTRG